MKKGKIIIVILIVLLSKNSFSQPGGAGNWNLVFEDNFTGTTLDQTKWGYNYPWGHTHNHRAYMTDSMVTVKDGLMTIKAINKRHPDAPAGTDQYASSFGYLSFDYTSGAIHSKGKFETTYGYIEGRLKIPSTLGTWPAFWTLNDDGSWPPEIDILEVPGDRKVHHYYYHYGPDWQNASSFGSTHTGVDKSLDFHTYGVEWGPDYMKFYFDGQLVNSYTGHPETAQGKNMYLLINLAIGGWAPNPAADAVFPALYQCDWVRVWKANPNANWDFETGNLSPWGPWNNAAITQDCKRGGTYGVKLTGSPVSIERTVILEPNTNYVFGGYGKVNTSGEHVMFGVKNYGGNQITKLITSTSFVKDSVVFTTGSSNTTAVVFFYKDAGTGTACGDDFFFYKANIPPTVSLTAPANNATFTAPASITINAAASDANGTVSNVQFFNGTTLLATDATSPYSFTWTNVAAGTYSITAKATDNNGAVTTSASLNAIVTSAVSTAPFANGADVGWLTEMEAAGRKFYDDNGTQQDLFDILKSKCINTIRLRVWANPAGGWNNKSDVVAKAIRAKNKGFRIMIDFHYSDSWADPGQQNKPAAWVGHSISQLVTDVSTHTTDILNALKANGITPEWVQVGNETNNGMLWEEGRASVNMNNFALLINSGYNAVKTVSPTSKVIVHLSNGFDNSLFRWMFDGLKNNGAQWDVIGMSLYPSTTDWSTLTTQCLSNMNDMVSRYGKEVMVVEVGMDVSAAVTCNSFLTDIIQKTKSVTGDKGLGVIYWEPAAYNGWQGYNLGAFDNSGKPTVALNAFLNGCTIPTCSATISAGSATTFCQGGSVVLTASTGASYIWKNGSTQVGTAMTYTATAAGSYTVEVTNSSACKATSAATTVIVNTTPASPTVSTPVNYCQNATPAVLTAAGTSLKWYTVPTSGISSTTAPTPSTTATGTTSYYVSQTVSGCESARAMIAVTVNAAPSAPAVTTQVNYCQNTSATALAATGTALKWYTVPTNGTSSTTAPTPSTTAIGTTSYYVSQTVSGCESARALIAVTVNAAPSMPSISTPVTYCQNATATALSAIGTSLKWYTVPTNGTSSTTAPTPSTTATGTTSYYVSQTVSGCESARALIAVTVNAAPSMPSISTPVTYCQNAASTALAATGTALKWYTVPTNGTSSTTAPTPSTTAIGTISYYVSQTVSGCESARALIAVTVNAAPSAPTVTTLINYCQNAVATALTATGTALKWYTVPTNGTNLTTAPTPSTTATGTTSYYVSQTVSGCESARAMIAVTVNAAPSAPTVSTPATYCQNAIATALTANGTSLKWYSVPTSGTSSTTAPTPSTTAAGTATYYVSQTASGCESARAMIVVTVNALPSATITPDGPTTFTQGGSVILSANTGTGLTYKWFNGITQVGTGATYTAITGGSYTVEVSNAFNCLRTSSAAIVTVNGNQPPVVSITAPANNSTFTAPANVTISATAIDVDGTITKVDFYNGTNLLGTDPTSPYSFAFNNLLVGTYTITAQATDNTGAVIMSSPITITVAMGTGIFSKSGVDVFSKVYPVPANSQINIETNLPLADASFKFLDALGSEATVAVTINGTNANVDLSSLASGIYTLLISQDDFIIRKKIIIIH